MTRKLLQAAVALAATAALLSACAGPRPTVDHEPVSAPVRASATPAPAVWPPAGAAFFDELRPGGMADLVPPFDTLKEAYANTTAVIEAEVTGVRPGRSRGETPASSLHSVLVDLRPVRVLRGALQPGLPVSVEFGVVWAPTPVGPVVDRMNADLPGRGIWLLSWQGRPPLKSRPGTAPAPPPETGGLYWASHPDSGILVQGETHVEVPAAQHPDGGGAQAEAERFGTLEELADHAVRA